MPDLCPQTHAQVRFSTRLGNVSCVKVQIPINLEQKRFYKFYFTCNYFPWKYHTPWIQTETEFQEKLLRKKGSEVPEKGCPQECGLFIPGGFQLAKQSWLT